MFRSTGSYEPDPNMKAITTAIKGFDPQALTSLTGRVVLSVMGLIGFDPQALTSLTFGIYCKHDNTNVSIHRLLRA